MRAGLQKKGTLPAMQRLPEGLDACGWRGTSAARSFGAKIGLAAGRAIVSERRRALSVLRLWKLQVGLGVKQFFP
jgi:hypothetical protein